MGKSTKSNVTVEELVSIAKEVEAEDPIDWGLLSIDEENAYKLMASHVIELFENSEDIVLKATILKLLVENFMLNYRLLQDK
jgi:hypothetical protein